MFETYILALTTFFATVGPIDIAVVFAGLTSQRSVRTKKKIAFKGVMIASGILLMASVQGDVAQQSMVVAGLLSIMLMTYVSLVGASQIHRVVGVTGLQVITRVFGVILCSLAVQFMFDGIKNSGIFT